MVAVSDWLQSVVNRPIVKYGSIVWLVKAQLKTRDALGTIPADALDVSFNLLLLET